MKILIICHEFPPVGGGAANATFYLAKHMAASQHQVTVLTSKFKKARYKAPGFDVVRLPVLRRYIDRAAPIELLSFALSGIFYALFNIRKQKYDTCLAMHGIPSGWVALFIYKIFKIPYVVSLRGADVPGFLPQEYDRLHKKVKILTRAYWKNAKSIITNSQGLKALAEVIACKLGKEVKIIPNGVDCQKFNPDYSLRDTKNIRLLYTGRITLQKGLGPFIEALKQVVGSIKNNFNMKIIGNGYLKNHLKEISSELSSRGTITFCDWMDKQKLREEYKKAHIFVLPSLYEGMSNSLLEAMSCGCMAIVSDIPGSRELVKGCKNGFVFNVGDSSSLKDILITALSRDVAAIEEMGRQSRAIAQGFDWNKVSDLYIKEFYA